MTSKLFYKNIVPLNRDKHRNLHISPAEDKARFAENTHYAPLSGTEFYQAARDYPILFTSDNAEAGPIALLGLSEGQNLFVDEDGGWSEGTYVPAFVRRYPFILARGDDSSNFTLCIDDSFAGFSESEGEALFDEEGKDSEYLTRTVAFINSYAAESEHTRGFVKKLAELEMLTKKTLQITDGKGRKFFINDFAVIDKEMLAKLDAAELEVLHKNGWLGWIYAHLVSLGNLSRMPLRVPAAEADAAEASA